MQARAASPKSLSLAIPTREDALRMFFRRIAHAIAHDPARYNITQEDAARLADRAAAVDAACRVPHHSRTQEDTKRKAEAIRAARTAFRAAIQQIKRDPDVSLSDKFDLGFRSTTQPRRRPRNSFGIPSQFEPGETPPPELRISSAGDGYHILHYTDHRGRKARPAGIARLELRIIIAPAPRIITNPDAAPNTPLPLAEGQGVREVRTEIVARSPHTINYPRELAGLNATCFGRWIPKSARRPPSEWSQPVAMTVVVAGGGAAASWPNMPQRPSS